MNQRRGNDGRQDVMLHINLNSLFPNDSKRQGQTCRGMVVGRERCGRLDGLEGARRARLPQTEMGIAEKKCGG